MSDMAEYPTMKSRSLTFTHDIPIFKTKTYWEGLKDGKVYATKCKKCGEIYYPPQGDCPKCLISNIEWIQLVDGEIETFTQAYLKPQGFEHYKHDFIIAIAKTLEGVKVMGLLENIDLENIKIGIRVKITAQTMPDGFPVIIFKPA
jgi:uncharacterized OB-fold protein